MGDRKGKKDIERSEEESMPSDQGIKEVFLKEVAPDLDLEEWVELGQAEIHWQDKALHVEEIVWTNTQAENCGMCKKKIRIIFTWLQLKMSEEECLRFS